MNKQNKILLALFFGTVIIKILLSWFIKSPSIFSDEYVYIKMAQSFFNENAFLLNGNPVAKYPPLYPIILSLSYLSSNMFFVYSFIKIINALLISSVIFPLYFISKNYLSSRKALLISFAASLVSPFFIFNDFVMAENIYFPLCIWAIYFIYRGIISDKKSDFILAGLLSGFAVLTKLFGLALLPVLGIMWISRTKITSIKNVIFYYSGAAVLIIPWIIRNFLNFGRNVSSLSGGYKSPWMLVDSLTSKIIPFLNWNITYWGYILLGSGFIFFVYFLAYKKIKDKSFRNISIITLLFTFFTVIIAANLSTNYKFYLIHAINSALMPGRIVGRYVEVVIPLFIVLGYIVYEKIKIINFSKFYIIVISVLIIFATQIFSNSLFPLNNSSVAIFGLLQKMLFFLINNEFIVLILAMSITSFVFILLLLYVLRFRKFLVIFAVLFLLLNSIISFGMIYWNSQIWYNSDQIDVSEYITNNVSSDLPVFIDRRYCAEVINKNTLNTNLCDSGNFASLMGFFIINPVTAKYYDDIAPGSIFISLADIDSADKIFESKNYIKIYRKTN